MDWEDNPKDMLMRLRYLKVPTMRNDLIRDISVILPDIPHVHEQTILNIKSTVDKASMDLLPEDVQKSCIRYMYVVMAIVLLDVGVFWPMVIKTTMLKSG